MTWLEVSVEIVDKGPEAFLLVREFGWLYTIIVLACAFTAGLSLLFVSLQVGGRPGLSLGLGVIGAVGGTWLGVATAEKIKDRRQKGASPEVYKRVKEHPEWLLDQACKLADLGRADLGRKLIEMGIENANMMRDNALAETLRSLLIKYGR